MGRLRYVEKTLTSLFPEFVYRTVGAVRGFTIRAKKFHSQYGEDYLIEQFFRHRRIENGFYVDIGGFHPYQISNTKRLHDRGWTGAVVDIDEYKTKLFKWVRGNAIEAICAAITPEGGTGQSDIYCFRRLWSEVDTLDPAFAEAYRKESGIPFTTRKVNTLGINDLIQRLGRKHIHFLNIDVEGLDSILIKAIDFTKYTIDMICFEDNDNPLPNQAISGYLGIQGYQRLFSAGGSHCFALQRLIYNQAVA